MNESLQKSVMQVPGNPGVWLFLLVELTTFALLFMSYALMYRLDMAAFQYDQQQLNVHWGTANTILLLTAGLAMVLATQANEKSNQKGVRRYLLWASLFGCGYVVLKFSEWIALYTSGITMGTSNFFGFYYFLSAFHWLHVVLGLVFIINIRAACHKDHDESMHPDSLESMASYWHMVDLLWLILFVLLYVV